MADIDLAKRKADLRRRLNDSYARREKQKEHLWAKFRADQGAIKDSYQSALDELWKRKPTDRKLEPEAPIPPPRKSELKMWAKAMRLLAHDHHRPHAKLNFREALTKIVQARDPQRIAAARSNLGKRLVQMREGHDVMLPARNTADARRFANAARQTKKQRSDEIRKARDQDIANRAALYERDKAALTENQATEIKTGRLEKLALWREGKREQIEAASGTAREEFKRVADLPPEKQSKAKELYEALADELRTKHGMTDRDIAIALRKKAEALAPDTWRPKTAMEELHAINERLGYEVARETMEADKPLIAHEAVTGFVSRLGIELELPPREIAAIVGGIAEGFWEMGQRPHIGHGDMAFQEPGEPTWRERISQTEAEAAPEQDNTTGTWRDAADGPDWSSDVPAPGQTKNQGHGL